MLMQLAFCIVMLGVMKCLFEVPISKAVFVSEQR